jgi:hypothetical protein
LMTKTCGSSFPSCTICSCNGMNSYITNDSIRNTLMVWVFSQHNAKDKWVQSWAAYSIINEQFSVNPLCRHQSLQANVARHFRGLMNGLCNDTKNSSPSLPNYCTSFNSCNSSNVILTVQRMQ